ncbi:MAG: tyrosine-protein phosphatase [Spirosomataceae bacterium]
MFESLFRKRSVAVTDTHSQNTLLVDVHSHVLPCLDDGAENLDNSLALLRGMKAMGYKKVIATPHVMSGYYDNTIEKINQALGLVRDLASRNNIDIEVEAAAEYYLEDELLNKIEQGEKMLTLDEENKYLLFETSFIGRPSYLKESVYRIIQAGYKPVLAHPERYTYLQKDFDSLKRLFDMGVLFQVNINSLTGYYLKPAQDIAEWLINRKMVAFLGSDCHNVHQLENTKSALQLPHYQIAVKQNLLNNSLLKKKTLVSA